MTAPAPGTRCRGERRTCSAPAVVVRQGRPLCPACDDLRRASRNRRGHRKIAATKREATVGAIEALLPGGASTHPALVRLGALADLLEIEALAGGADASRPCAALALLLAARDVLTDAGAPRYQALVALARALAAEDLDVLRRLREGRRG